MMVRKTCLLCKSRMREFPLMRLRYIHYLMDYVSGDAYDIPLPQDIVCRACRYCPWYTIGLRRPRKTAR